MSYQPPPPRGAQPARYEQPRVIAPTLGGFWRSDVRRQPGRKPVRWPGRVALIVGAMAVVLMFASAASQSLLLVNISLALSWTAGFFALVALIADTGRLTGLLGLILAVAGNVIILGWLAQLFA